jgi:hypothetical protein
LILVKVKLLCDERRKETNMIPRFVLLLVISLVLASCATPQLPGENSNAQLQTTGTIWSSLNPGAGGQIQAVVLDPNVTDHAYLLSDVEGLYKTTNGGSTWVYRGKGLAGTDALSLAVTPGNSSRIYLGTSVGLHTSTDGGTTWKLHPAVNRSGSLKQITDNPNDPGFGPDKMSIGSVVVNPKTTTQVVAGLGGRRWSLVNRAAIFRSTNSGANFVRVDITPAGGGNQSVLQLATRQTSGNTWLFAALGDAGLWVSRDFGASGTWFKIPKSSAALERADGVAISPDNGTLYAVYRDARNAENTVIFATRLNGLDARSGQPQAGDFRWKELPYGGVAGNPTANTFRTVAFDPSVSSRGSQRMVAASDNGRKGLYELTVTWSNPSGNWTTDTPTATWNRVFYFDRRKSGDPNRIDAPFDIGWEGGSFGTIPRPLSYQYTPVAWNKRELWTTGDQTIFKTNRSLSDFQNRWQPLYTASVREYPVTETNIGWTTDNTVPAIPGGVQLFTLPSDGPVKTYRTTGTASTVDFDADQYGQIIISAKGDNGVMMSYDGGASWENVSPVRRARAHSALLVKKRESSDIIAVANVSDPFDFGAENTEDPAKTTGELWGRSIDPNNPVPGRWYYLAGGKGRHLYEWITPVGGDGTYNLGLPDDIYTNILPHPANPRRVYITTKFEGIYVIEDIENLLCYRQNNPDCKIGPNFIRKVSDVNSNEYEGSAVIDPNNPNFMYVADKNTVKKVNLSNYTFETLRQNGNASILASIDVWSDGTTTWLAATQDANQVYITKNPSTSPINWQLSFDRFNLMAKRTPNFDFSISQNKIELFGLEGDGNRMYAVVQVQNPENLGYGVFEITFDRTTGKPTSTGIRDITFNHYFPKSFRTEVLTDAKDGKKYLLMSSWGAGLWRLPLF